jgi:hypothetical protein
MVAPKRRSAWAPALLPFVAGRELARSATPKRHNNDIKAKSRNPGVRVNVDRKQGFLHPLHALTPLAPWPRRTDQTGLVMTHAKKRHDTYLGLIPPKQGGEAIVGCRGRREFRVAQVVVAKQEPSGIGSVKAPHVIEAIPGFGYRH